MNKLLMKALMENQKKNVVFYGAQRRRRDALKWQSLFQVYDMELDIPVSAGDEQRLYSFEEAAKNKVDAFVVMRQMIANQNTFRQMLEYCKKHSADIYDENGRNISDVCNCVIERGYSGREELLEAIEKHDYISFDIFDTLLTRKVLLPEDVFALAERKLYANGAPIKRFKEKRLKVQSELGLTNPDIYDIYKKFQKKYKIDNELADLCIKTELEIEQEVLLPREDMLDIFRQCIRMGKRVCLVSDMYIPGELLVPILEKNGITGYDRLYISCDKKQLKLQGLLETYQNESGVTENLHIGDHVIHDGICAGLAGMEYCLVESSYKAAMRTMLREGICSAASLEEHVILGLVIAKLLNSPFAVKEHTDNILIQKDYDYGYGFCGALVGQFAIWIYEQVKREKFDDILFAARDGYLMQQLYRLILLKCPDENMPEGKYFYVSRKAAVMTGINNEAYINMIIDISNGMPPRKMMRERFGLPASQILEYDQEKYGDSIHKYVWEHANAIFARSDRAKRNYFKYMGNVGLNIGKRYAFMDFVSSGTSQKALMRIVPFELCGLYAGWNGTEDMSEVGVKALFAEPKSDFMRRYKIMETFMTSEEPSLNCFDDMGKPLFSSQDRKEEEISYVKEMQRACKDFLQDLLDIVMPEEGSIRNKVTDAVFAASKCANVKDSKSVLNHLRLMDDWRRKRNNIEDLVQ